MQSMKKVTAALSITLLLSGAHMHAAGAKLKRAGVVVWNVTETGLDATAAAAVMASGAEQFGFNQWGAVQPGVDGVKVVGLPWAGLKAAKGAVDAVRARTRWAALAPETTTIVFHEQVTLTNNKTGAVLTDTKTKKPLTRTVAHSVDITGRAGVVGDAVANADLVHAGMLNVVADNLASRAASAEQDAKRDPNNTSSIRRQNGRIAARPAPVAPAANSAAAAAAAVAAGHNDAFNDSLNADLAKLLSDAKRQ